MAMSRSTYETYNESRYDGMNRSVPPQMHRPQGTPPAPLYPQNQPYDHRNAPPPQHQSQAPHQQQYQPAQQHNSYAPAPQQHYPPPQHQQYHSPQQQPQQYQQQGYKQQPQQQAVNQQYGRASQPPPQAHNGHQYDSEYGYGQQAYANEAPLAPQSGYGPPAHHQQYQHPPQEQQVHAPPAPKPAPAPKLPKLPFFNTASLNSFMSSVAMQRQHEDVNDSEAPTVSPFPKFAVKSQKLVELPKGRGSEQLGGEVEFRVPLFSEGNDGQPFTVLKSIRPDGLRVAPSAAIAPVGSVGGGAHSIVGERVRTYETVNDRFAGLDRQSQQPSTFSNGADAMAANRRMMAQYTSGFSFSSSRQG